MVNELITVMSFDIETTGLEPIKLSNEKGKVVKECRITTIGVYDSKGVKSLFFDKNEKKLLIKFLDFVDSHRNGVWTGYNIIGFDIPFIIFRAIKYDLLNSKSHIWRLRYGVHKWLNPYVIDLAPIFQKGFNRLRKLQDVLIHCGLDNKTSDGLEAIRMWNEKRYGDLNDYVLNDAYVEFQLYKYCEEKGLIPPY